MDSSSVRESTVLATRSYQLIGPCSRTSRSFVKKKAALTLLRLYRKHPDVIPAAEWALRIISIMDDQNLGVALAVTSLVMTLAQDNLEAFSVCYQKAVDRLRRVSTSHRSPHILY